MSAPGADRPHEVRLGAGAPGPRLAPLRVEEWPETVVDRLEALRSEDGHVANIFTTFARHPALFARWLPFGGQLLREGTLPARERELLILRTAWNCRSGYEWGQHAQIASAAGLSAEEITRVADGPGAAGWQPFDAILLRAADELHGHARISDSTWERLAGRYDERQLLELPMLVGHYHLVAFALNSLRVERDPGVVGLPQRGA
jgi:4-carboxymuconolactone decarboxylase